jgi:hypothetical protein
VIGIATALTGMSRPAVLIYLMLAGIPPRAVRATLFAFSRRATRRPFCLHRHGRRAGRDLDWRGEPDPVRLGGRLDGRRVGDRLGVEAATVLALIVLIATGLYTVVAAARLALS